MTIYKNKKNGKLYTISGGSCGVYTGEVYVAQPYNWGEKYFDEMRVKYYKINKNGEIEFRDFEAVGVR